MSNKSRFSKNKNFTKSNFDQALRSVIPYLYYQEDESANNKEIDIFDQIINSQLNILQNVSSIVYVSSISASVYSSIDKIEGFSPFFVKQNSLTDIDCNDFERKILVKLGTSYSKYSTSSEFSDYINYTLLPGIRTNQPTLDFLNGGSTSANHIYLINNLSWLYFLNSSSTTLTYNPSSYVHDLIIDKFFTGGSVRTNDGIKGLTTYIWKNYESIPAWQQLKLLPNDFRPPSLTQNDSYTSGTQQLDKLLTLIDILYSPLYLDSKDTRVKDAIDDYITNGYKLTKEIHTGPFIKLVKAFSFAFADYTDSIDKLETLNDVNLCPDELLPKLADLIGWRLFGSEPDRWRLQIANAVDLYRKTGTKKSIQVAVDSVLGQDVFDVSSSISELWESYVPNLIYYALATESRLLEDLSTWTRDKATNFGILAYSTSSIDENVRLCVDEIIYQTCLKFRSKFLLDRKPFPIDSINFKFNYRNREISIPPFEEYPYYLNVIITDDMVDFIVDKLVCFGVRLSFALEVGEYIKNNTVRTTDDLAIKNGWLFFTSGVQYASNWNSIIKDITNTKSEYLPLWNGKSSHFKVLLEASSFDFSKTSLEADSSETIKIAAKTAQEFSPAHSIPDVMLLVKDYDNYSNSHAMKTIVRPDKVENQALFAASSNGYSMFGLSALAMQSYKRGLTPTAVQSFSRWDVDSIADSLRNPAATIAYLPRRAHRRRNLKNILPKDGFYDRTGFNMPVSLQDYQVQNASFLPLGLIPSSLQYVPITDYNNIPAVYDICEDLRSSKSFNGVSVSNTYPARGWVSPTGFDVGLAMDRGQLHPFVATLHYIGEQAKLLQASAYYSSNTSAYSAESWWKNVIQSYANSATEYSGAFPNSFEDYVDFKLGKDIHKLYHDYSHNFSNHRTNPMVTSQDGPVILAHALGSLLYNSDFSKRGSLTLINPNFITTNLANTYELRNKEGIFSSSGLVSGTYVTSSILNIGRRQSEYRNSGILDHIEFCQVSGTSRNNNFVVVDIDPSFKTSSRRNSLLDDNILIKQSAYDGFGRLIFNLSKYSLDPILYDISSNFLSPDHEFNIKFKSIISDSEGLSFGGGTIGVWIHTEPELDKVWSFTDGGHWIQHSASSITVQQVLDHSHLINFPRIDRPLIQSGCIGYLDRSNPNRKNEVIGSIKESDFNEISLNFHTKNHTCIGSDNTIVTKEYFENVSNHVHRLNQKYVIEIFTIPTQDDKFTLYYDLSMIDLTLNRWSKPFVLGFGSDYNLQNSYCQEYRVDLNKQQILSIIKYFNQIRGDYSKQGYAGANNLTGYASRVASTTQGFYEASGGSRINYMETPDWNPLSRNAKDQIEDITIIN